jgi:hypothetical protein
MVSRLALAQLTWPALSGKESLSLSAAAPVDRMWNVLIFRHNSPVKVYAITRGSALS